MDGLSFPLFLDAPSRTSGDPNGTSDRKRALHKRGCCGPLALTCLGGLRHCMNPALLRFIAVDDLEAEGYGQYPTLFTKDAS